MSDSVLPHLLPFCSTGAQTCDYRYDSLDGNTKVSNVCFCDLSKKRMYSVHVIAFFVGIGALKSGKPKVVLSKCHSGIVRGLQGTFSEPCFGIRV